MDLKAYKLFDGENRNFWANAPSRVEFFVGQLRKTIFTFLWLFHDQFIKCIKIINVMT